MTKTAGRNVGRDLGRDPPLAAGETTGPTTMTEADETYDNLMTLREKIGDNEQGRVNIQRRLADGTLVNLPSLPGKTFDVDTVAQRYGGGKYYVRFYQGREYLGSDTFTIDESIKPSAEKVPVAGDGTVMSANPQVAMLSAQVAAMDMILKSNQAMMNQLLAALVGKMAEKPEANDNESALEVGLQIADKIAAASAHNVPVTTSFKDQLEQATSIINLGRALTGGEEGGGGSGDAYMTAIAKLSEPIVELVRAKAQQAAAMPRRLATGSAVTPAPTHPPAIAAAPAVTALPTGGNMWLAEIQKWLPMIVGRAHKDKSAESTAYFILEELSEPTRLKLVEVAAQGMPEDATPDEALAHFIAQISPLLPSALHDKPLWVQEFLETVYGLLFESEGSDDDEASAGVEAEPVDAEPLLPRDLEAEAKRRLALLD